MIGPPAGRATLHDVFKAIQAMNPSKDAGAYWQTVNRTFLNGSHHVGDLWREEKVAAIESIGVARVEALTVLARERERIMKLSRNDAIREVLRWRRVESRVRIVESVSDNGLLEVG